MYRNAIICAVLGAFSGVIAFVAASPFLSDVPRQSIHRNFTLGSVYGLIAHGLFGALIVALISAFLGYIDWGKRGALVCGLVGTVLGALSGYGSDALFDWLIIKDLYPPGIEIGFIWSAIVCGALTLAIFLATGAKRHRIVRCLAVVGITTIIGGATRGMVATAVLVGKSLGSKRVSTGSPDWWVEVAGPAMLAGFIVIGIIFGATFGLVEMLMKSVRLRQILGRNEWRTWTLGEGNYRIGSAESSEIRIADAQLAPLHTHLVRQNGQFCIQEANGGLVVNGYQTPAHWLTEGDVIQLGSATFFFGEGSPPEPATPQATDPRLIDGFGNIFSLKPGVYVIGRDTDADIALTWDRKASNRHAEIRVGLDGVTVTDLDSTNGTTLDGNPVQTPTLIRPGAKIQIGASVLTYEA